MINSKVDQPVRIPLKRGIDQRLMFSSDITIALDLRCKSPITFGLLVKLNMEINKAAATAGADECFMERLVTLDPFGCD